MSAKRKKATTRNRPKIDDDTRQIFSMELRGVRQKLERSAQANERSLGAEIRHRLNMTFQDAAE